MRKTSSGTASRPAVRPNTLVRFDPKAEKFQSWLIPSGGGVVRHMMATPEGNLLLACGGVNRVALVEVNEVRNGDRLRVQELGRACLA